MRTETADADPTSDDQQSRLLRGGRQGLGGPAFQHQASGRS
ncbi:hypothetical protein [Streptomyces griseorubiginosus]